MNYHLIGIGGVSMSGLAKLLVSYGHEVSGCDLKQFSISNFQFSNKSQFSIFKGHKPDHITKDLDAVVVTAAATHDDSPAEKEVERARALSIRVISRSKLIGQIMSNKIGIAVAGMHGKTTVTTMIGLILEAAGYNPTVLVGSNVKKWQGNIRIPNAKRKTQNAKLQLKTKNLSFGKITDFFVAEACEYERQMLDFRPKIAVIINLEEEHLDTYPGGMKDIRQAFKKFIKMLPPNGLLVVNQDDKNLMPLTKAAKCKVKRFGLGKSRRPSGSGSRIPKRHMIGTSGIWPGLNLQIPGRHNLLNATAAARVCHELGVSHEIIKNTLNNFTGAGRRFEIKGVKNGITVIDDYGHHPTEIKATIQAAKEYLGQILNSKFQISNKTQNQKSNYQKATSYKPQANELIVVFQPHQYTRTKLLFNDFVKAFDGADKLIITDIYLIAGREPKEARADFSQNLVEAIKKQGVDAEYVSTYDKIVDRLQSIARSGDTILTIGATDIYQAGERFLKK